MEKKKRGANYTAEEKTLLAELITKYKHIIEDKRTGGILSNKKKEAWKAVTIKYNSNCTSGARETEQLKALYDNMKQKSRKIVAENNKMEYMKNCKVQDIVTQEDVEKALKNLKEDKVQMTKTGGGFWKPKSTDCDAKILAVIQEQVEPLPNPYDGAAAYFKEMDNIYGEDDCTAVASTSSAPTSSAPVPIDEDQGLQTKTSTKNIMTPSQGRVLLLNKKKVPKKIKKDNSTEALKRLYFKKKIENAQMERKKLALEILYMKEKHKLEIEIF